MEKTKQVFNPFMPVHEAYEGQKDFDEFYEEIKIVDYVVKTGEGEQDFIIQKKVVVDKKPIKDVVEADRDSVGVENIIKQVMKTGDMSLLPVDRGTGEISDFVGAPESLMELKQLGEKAEKGFNSLPKEMIDGLDMVSFVNSMTQEKFDSFLKAVVDRAAGKTESEVTKDE